MWKGHDTSNIATSTTMKLKADVTQIITDKDKCASPMGRSNAQSSAKIDSHHCHTYLTPPWENVVPRASAKTPNFVACCLEIHTPRWGMLPRISSWSLKVCGRMRTRPAATLAQLHSQICWSLIDKVNCNAKCTGSTGVLYHSVTVSARASRCWIVV